MNKSLEKQLQETPQQLSFRFGYEEVKVGKILYRKRIEKRIYSQHYATFLIFHFHTIFPYLESVVLVAVAVANIEAVEGGTDGGVVTLVEQQIYSSLSSQLELNILRIAVVLVSIAQRDPAVLVN